MMLHWIVELKGRDSPGECDPRVPVYDDPPVPHDGGHVVPGHLDWAGGAEVSRDEDPVSGVRAATDLHPREVNHRPLGAERHRGRGVRVRDADIERPGAEVDIEIPEERVAALQLLGGMQTWSQEKLHSQ